MTKKREKGRFSYFKLAVALIFLINPCIKYVDLLADFISCIIIKNMLKDYCDRSEGFTEARDAFVKLGWLSFMKIPAFIIAVMVRSKNTIDNDINVLFTLVFAVAEAYLLIEAVRYLFVALFHVGLRGGADATILPFSVLGKKAKIKPEILRILTFAFAVVKSLSCFLPELLMLSTTEDAYGNPKLFRLKAMYPTFFSIGAVTTLIFGIIIVYLFVAYIRAIHKEGALKSGIVSLHTEGELLEIEEIIRAKALKKKLHFLAIAAFFHFDIAIESMGSIDLVPDFIFGIFLLVAAIKLTEKSALRWFNIVSISLYSVIALFNYISTYAFLNDYEYASLIHKAAKDAYLPILYSSIAQSVLLILIFFTFCLTLTPFIENHVIFAVAQKTKTSLKNRRRIIKSLCVFGTLGALCSGCKAVSSILNYNVSAVEFIVDSRPKDIITTALPWFGSFSFVLTIAFVAYTCYFVSCLCDEIELNYS